MDDKITIERETLERAISALSDDGPPTQLITALRAALAAQPADAQQEPVAIVTSKYGDPERFGEREIRVLVDLHKIPYDTKLYAAPPAPAAVPLTDAQIDGICWNLNCSNTPLVEYDRLIARAIERAHGIAAGDKP